MSPLKRFSHAPAWLRAMHARVAPGRPVRRGAVPPLRPGALELLEHREMPGSLLALGELMPFDPLVPPTGGPPGATSLVRWLPAPGRDETVSRAPARDSAPVAAPVPLAAPRSPAPAKPAGALDDLLPSTGVSALPFLSLPPLESKPAVGDQPSSGRTGDPAATGAGTAVPSLNPDTPAGAMLPSALAPARTATPTVSAGAPSVSSDRPVPPTAAPTQPTPAAQTASTPAAPLAPAASVRAADAPTSGAPTPEPGEAGAARAPLSAQARIGFNHTDLDRWGITIIGGTAAGAGSVRTGSALMEEGDSFLVGLEQSFAVPANPAPLVFTYTDLAFDTSDPNSIHDAFEVSLVDAAGAPVVHGFTAGRDSFFNVTEGVGLATGPGATETGGAVKTVTLDMSGILPGTQATLRFRLVNNDRDTGTRVRILDVFVPSANHSPQVAGVGERAGTEGTVVAIATTFADPDAGDTHTATVEWGDGTSSSATVTPSGTGTYAVTATHVYADDGTYAARLTVTDSGGAMGETAFAVRVSNAAPVVTAGVSFRQGAAGAALPEVVLAGAFTDPGFTRAAAGTAETFAAEVDWGDGSVTPVALTVMPGGEGRPTTGRYAAAHAYAQAGVYTARVTVRDDDAGAGAATARQGVARLSVTRALDFGAGGSVPVLVPRDPGFDATQIDAGSVRFAPAGARPASGVMQVRATDVRFNFTVAQTGAHQGDTSAFLTGRLLDGTPFASAGAVTVAGGAALPAASAPGATQFFVADAAADRSYRYTPTGVSAGSFALDVTARDARGAASNAAGDRVWVIDGATQVVTVQGPSGALLGYWRADGLQSPTGVTTDGTDVWAVDAATRKVLRYAGAAALLSGSAVAVASFALHADNANPSDLVTDGNVIWVTDEGRDEVFVYDPAGALLGRWKLDPRNADASGVTRDPTGASADLWVVDRADRVVYRYAGAAGWRDGSRTAADTFALSAGNTQPEGIADPPPDIALDPTPADGRVPANTSAILSGHAAGGSNFPAASPGTPAVIRTADFDGHRYYLLDSSFWREAEDRARQLGGHLATINDAAENQFVLDTFGPTAVGTAPDGRVSLWIGLNDEQDEGQFVWSSGESVGYSNWTPGEPAGTYGDEDDVGISVNAYGLPGGWHDVVRGRRFNDVVFGVVEVAAPPGRIERVTVNGVPVDALDAAGNFFARAPVAPGTNTFTFTATDSLGQTATAGLTLEGAPPSAGGVDFGDLSDLAPGSFAAEYGRTSWQAADRVLLADLAVRNAGRYAADAPLLVGVTNISDPTVRVRNPDGVTPDGVPYYDLSALVAGGTLAPGGVIGARTLAFFDPNAVRFTYDLVFLGHLNQAPAITSVPDVEALAGRPYTYAVTATDPEADPLTFSLVTAPAGMTIDPTTGRVTWTPSAGDIGTPDVRVRVEDGRGGSAEQRYALSVIAPPPNRPPVFTSVPAVGASVGAAYTYAATATDPDGDPLAFALVSGPPGLTVNATTGVVSWTPAASQIGTPPVTLRVSDGRGGTATQTFAVRVDGVSGNHAPVIVTDPVTTAAPGQAYRYDVDAIDPDADPLTYSLDLAPDGMTIDPATGQIAWAVPADEPVYRSTVTFGSAVARSVATDSLGNVYLAGSIGGVVDFDSGPGVVTLSPAGPQAAFVAKYSRAGALLWARSVQGGGRSRVDDLAVDASDNLYVTGSFTGTADFDPGAGQLLLPGPGGGAFYLWKLDASGNLVWARATGGTPGQLNNSGVAIDDSGDIVLLGSFFGTIDADPGATAVNFTSVDRAPVDGGTNPGTDTFVAKFTPDGTFRWARHLGTAGGFVEAERDVATDAAGNILISGRFQFTVDFDPGAGTQLRSSVGQSEDAFVLKLTADGDFVWVRQFGGGGAERGRGIDVDEFGNVALASIYSDAADYDPGPGTFVLPHPTRGYDAGIVKLTAAGEFLWAVALPGGGEDASYDLAFDGSGNVITTGSVVGARDFDPGPGTTVLDGGTPFRWYTAKLSPDGRFLWAQAAGGFELAVDCWGDIYSAGDFQGTYDFDPGPADGRATSSGGTASAFLTTISHAPTCPSVTVRVADGRGGSDTQTFTIDLSNRPPAIVSTPVTTAFGGTPYTYDVDAVDPDADALTYALVSGPAGMTIDPSSGVVSWTSSSAASTLPFRLGSTGNDYGRTGHVDAAGNVYLVGQFSGTVDFDPGVAVLNLTSRGQEDAFVAKYDPAGRLLWARRVGGVGEDIAVGVNVDPSGNVYAMGRFSDSDDFDPGPGARVLTSAGAHDIFVWKLNAAGGLVWAQRLGGGGEDNAVNTLLLDNAGGVYVPGQFHGTVDFDPGNGVFAVSSAGGQDGFIWKLDADGNFVWARSVGGGTGDSVRALAQDSAGNIYAAGEFNQTSSGPVDFDPGPGVFALGGFYQAFAWKLTRAGDFVWARAWGGGGEELVNDIDLDSVGNVYATGWFTGTTDLDPGLGVYPLTSAADADGFVLKLNAAGEFAWGYGFGSGTVVGPSQEGGQGVYVDRATDEIYTDFSFLGTASFGPGAFSVTSRGAFDTLLVKLGTAGNVLSTFQFGGQGRDWAGVFGVDSTGAVYLTGQYAQTVDFDPGSGTHILASSGEGDTFLMALSPSGGLVRRVAATVRVEDGRGGSATQTFTIDVSTAAPATIRGTLFDDLNGDGARNAAPTLLVSNVFEETPAGRSVGIARYSVADGRSLGSFLSGGDLRQGWGYAFGPDGFLYVVDWETARILKYNGTTGQFVSVLTSDSRLRFAGDIIIGADGNLLVTNGNDVRGVMRFNRTTGQAMSDFIPLGRGGLVAAGEAEIGPDGYLYVANIRGADQILRFDATTGAFIDTFATLPTHRSSVMSHYGPGGLYFGPDGDLYLSDQGETSSPSLGGPVMRFDGVTGIYKGDFVPDHSGGLKSPRGLAWNSDGRLYVASSYGDEVLRYDAVTGAFIDKFATLDFPYHLEFASTLEPTLAGRTVYLDDNRNGRRDAGERSATTDAGGGYSFAGLAAGTYAVAQELPAGWVQTVPAGGQSRAVTLAVGQVVIGADFGGRVGSEPTAANRPPAFTGIAPAAATVGQLFRYDAAAADPDGDALAFDLVVKPLGMAVDSATGIVVWVPAADQVGPQDVTLRVQDGRGGVALQSFRLAVTRPNGTPVITSTPTGSAVAAVPWRYQVQAQDSDGDPLAFALAGPDGMTVDPTTGLVAWTPTVGQVGTQHVAVTVSDGRGASATQSFDLPVVATAPNGAPAITSVPRASIRVGDTYLYQVVAADPNADPLAYTLDVAPAGMTVSAAGLVSWVPTAAQLGSNAVAVRVSDGRGGFAAQSFTVQVVTQATNRAPAVTSTPPGGATVGRLYAYNLTGTDPDGDPLVWTLDAAPAGASVDPRLGTLRWTPAADQVGSQTFAVRATDGQGGFATQRFTVTVRAVNVPPGITSAPPTTAAVGQPYSYAVRATDPDGDPVTFALTAAPAGATVDAATGLVRWTPTAAQLGTQSFALRAEDGQGGFAEQTFAVVVTATAANRAPAVTSAPPLAATAARPYSYPVTAVDPDGDPVLFSLLAAPAGMTIDPATGLVAWTPTLAQVGLQTVTVAAIDPSGTGGTQTFAVAVADGNRAPAITSSPTQTVTAGLAYRYDVRAADPDGDPLTYRLDQAPAGMTIDALGRVTWAPGIPDVGTHRVAVTAADPRGASVTQTFDVAVLADTQAPRINLVVSDNPVNVGAPVTFVVTATDNVGVASLGLFVNGTAVPLDAAGRVTLRAEPAGSYAVVARATDAAGLVGTATTTLSVIDTSDATPPDVDITAPLDGSVLTFPVDVLGTATDAALVAYVLEVAPTDTGVFTEFARGTAPVVDGVLGRFDPSGLANGSYLIRLRATDAGGNESSVETAVEVAGDLKVGNFTLSFTDLSIPVSGIPVTLARTYDTLQAGRRDDFGFGWRMEFRDTDLRTSLPPTGEEEYGVYNAFRAGTRVYVTLPGGRREGFTFRPERLSGFGGTFAFYKPAFVADPGVTDRLSVPDDVTLILVNGGYHALNQLAYNPADALNFAGQYTVTTKDGLAYSVDAVTGDLNAVADAHGNALTFTDAAITSSAGPRVTFARDPQGRITSVTDPAGNVVRYRYDAAGDLVGVTDRAGNETRFVYAQPGRAHFLTRVVDPLGRTGVRTEYDDQGRLVAVVDAAGNAVRLAHDPDHALETVTDALGNRTTFEYDARGNVVTEVDARGGVTRRTYDANNNPLTETDPLGRTRAFTYDGDGNVLTETDALGNVTRNTYTTVTPGTLAAVRGARPVTLLTATTDPQGNTTTNTYAGTDLVATTDAAGNTTRFSYDGAGNQTAITDAAGNVTRFAYDARGNLTAQTDALGHATVYTYDGNGNQLTQATTLTTPGGVRTLTTATTYDADGHPLTVTDAEGHTTRTEYDALGRQAATVDALGHRTAFAYDDRGQLTRTTFADGTFALTEYDAAGRRVASTDRAGRVTRFVYDALGRLTETVYPDSTPLTLADNPRTRTEYDAAGEVIAQLDERGNRTEFGYDAAGRQVVVRDALGRETRTAYDTAGRTASTTDALGHTTRFGYDALGRQTTTVFADGTAAGTAYDALGRVTRRTDQLGRATRYEYDALGRLTAVVDALDQRTEYGYDEAGDLVTQKDANSHVTHYEYDGLGRRTATALPMGQRSATHYDAVGNVAEATDFDGDSIRYEYDANNRLVAKHLPDGTAVRFTYTADGQRDTATDARGATRYAYDERNRLRSRTDPDGTAVAYTYDAAGNRTSVTTPAGTTGYTFDALNRTATVTDSQGGVTRYAYNEVGNLARTDLPDGTSETRQYDALNRLVLLENRGPGGVISSYTYTLAATGRRDAVLEDTGRRVAYTYDALDRLTGETVTDSAAGNRAFGYTYDPVGNRLTRTDTRDGTTTYAYDADDRLLTETTGGAATAYTYDASGNTLTKTAGPTDRAAYTWDAENRLIAADVTDATGTHHITNRYDADGVRVSQTTDGEETRYLIDTVQPYAQVLLEYRPSGLVLVSYVHGNDLISQFRAGAKSFYHVDGLGSTRALTDATGAVTDRYVYDAFGRTIGGTGTTPNSYLFAGEQRDRGLGLDYLRARYLSVGTGRFYGMDPIDGDILWPRSLHRFQYGFSNPLSYHDPSGEFPVALSVAVGAVIEPLVRPIPQVRFGAQSTTRSRGRPTPKEFIVDFRTPTIALNNADSQSRHPEWRILNYEPILAIFRRLEAIAGIPSPPAGFQRDEYPYASTYQGGRGADVDIVPAAENRKQGSLLRQFYFGTGEYARQGSVMWGEAFRVVVRIV